MWYWIIGLELLGLAIFLNCIAHAASVDDEGNIISKEILEQDIKYH